METLSVNGLASRFLIFLEKKPWKLDIHDAEPIVGHFYASSFFKSKSWCEAFEGQRIQ